MVFESFYRLQPLHPFTIELQEHRKDCARLSVGFAALAERHGLETRTFDLSGPSAWELIMKPSKADLEAHRDVFRPVEGCMEGFVGLDSQSAIHRDWRRRLDELELEPGPRPSIAAYYLRLGAKGGVGDLGFDWRAYLAGDEALLQLRVFQPIQYSTGDELQYYEEKLRQQLSVEKAMKLPRLSGSEFYRTLEAQHTDGAEYGIHSYYFELPQNHPDIVALAAHEASLATLYTEFAELAKKHGVETHDFHVNLVSATINPTPNDRERFRRSLQKGIIAEQAFGHVRFSEKSAIIKEWHQTVKEKGLTLEPCPNTFTENSFIYLVGQGYSWMNHTYGGRSFFQSRSKSPPIYEPIGLNRISAQEYFAGMTQLYQEMEQAGEMKTGSEYFRQLRDDVRSRLDPEVEQREEQGGVSWT